MKALSKNLHSGIERPRRSLGAGFWLAALLGAVSAGCTLQPELVYDPPLMKLKLGPSPSGLVPGEYISKRGATSLLLGPRRDGLNPVDFKLDPRKVEAVFGPGREGDYQFVLLSDLQIRDRCVDLGPWLSRFIDKNPFNPIEVTLLNFYQDHADVFYAGFVLKAIRMGVEKNRRIDFVAHLGDSMQLGIRSELGMFSEVVGKFLLRGEEVSPGEAWRDGWLTSPILLEGGRTVPFYNLLGNHDVLIMGNFDEHGPINPRGVAPDNTCIGSLESLKEAILDLRAADPVAYGGGEIPPVLGGGTREDGYYTVDRRLPDGKLLRLVMLHTNESNILDPLLPSFQRGALYPSLGEGQYRWLEETLDQAERPESGVEAVLVFAHNELAELTVNRTGLRKDRDQSVGEVAGLLGRHPKVTGFFSGHLHSGCRPVRWSFPGHEFYEYLQPAVQEYPKCWAVVTYRPAAEGAAAAIRVKYYNLEDILDVAGSKDLDVRDDNEPVSYQKRFYQWLVALEQATPRIEDRVKLLAEYCYRGSRFDVIHDLREDVCLAFNPAIADRLLETYRGANEFWKAVKKESLTWEDHRKLLEADPVDR